MWHWILFAYVVVIGIETGAGLFTSVVVFPTWAASFDAVIGWKPSMPYFMEEGWFFQFSSTTTMLLAMIVAIMCKKFPRDVRTWVLISSVIFFVIFIVTFAYFIPEQFRVHGDAGAALPREQVEMMLGRFLSLNWIRQISLVVAFVAAVHALGLMYRRKPEVHASGH